MFLTVAKSLHWLDVHVNEIADIAPAYENSHKAIQLDPNLDLAYIGRAYAYRALGQYTLADADETMACSLDSQYC